jgi:hypothetical protein
MRECRGRNEVRLGLPLLEEGEIAVEALLCFT